MYQAKEIFYYTFCLQRHMTIFIILTSLQFVMYQEIRFRQKEPDLFHIKQTPWFLIFLV